MPVNTEAFDAAVRAGAEATQRLPEALVTKAPRRDREVEAVKAKARNEQRYGR